MEKTEEREWKQQGQSVSHAIDLAKETESWVQ